MTLKEQRTLILILCLVTVVYIIAVALAFASYSQGVSLRPDGQTGTGAGVTCGLSSGTLLAANPRRRDSLFSALSTNTATVSICPFTPCTTAAGIPNGPGGTVRDNSYVGAWTCISGTAGQTIIVTETSR